MSNDIQNCCRICLDVESYHVSVLEDPIVNLHVKSCLSIVISSNDSLPKTVCVSCVSQLSEFYNFLLNAQCSQDWLESSLKEKNKKNNEAKTPIQPLPDSEYNSDSLLEFLNNTANIEEYLNNLGKEDIPSIVNMLDKQNESSSDNTLKGLKVLSPKKKLSPLKDTRLEVDVLHSDIKATKELLSKKLESITINIVKDLKCTLKQKNKELKVKSLSKICFGCKAKFGNVNKLSQHLSICDAAKRTCDTCDSLFDSKQKMIEHKATHHAILKCTCSKTFKDKYELIAHFRNCRLDYMSSNGYIYRCKLCKEMFTERSLLHKHVKEHLYKSEEKMCDICGHAFIGNEALQKHRKQKHNMNEEMLYRCKICKLTSPSHKELFLHVQKHTSKETSRPLCESCGRSFATLATLTKHSSLHSKEVPCGICGKLFTSLKNRDEHILGHTESVMCEKCGQSVDSSKFDHHVCSSSLV